MAENGHDMASNHDQGHGDARPGGLLVSEHGYTLDLDAPILSRGTQTVTFRVIGPGGDAVTEFETAHEKELHFIAVRRDTTGFQHVHPVRDQSGTWSVDLDFTPGVWRLFADFHPAGHGEPLTLGIDASVAGQYEPQPLPAITQNAQVEEYTVTLKGGLRPSEASELTFTVHRNGKPVTDLQPYLGAFGHLVALRAGDLAYLHVHPDGEPSDGTTAPGPDISFVATAPSAGSYRLHLDFQHEGIIRTAQFTVAAEGSVRGLGHENGHNPVPQREESAHHGGHAHHA